MKTNKTPFQKKIFSNEVIPFKHLAMKNLNFSGKKILKRNLSASMLCNSKSWCSLQENLNLNAFSLNSLKNDIENLKFSTVKDYDFKVSVGKITNEIENYLSTNQKKFSKIRLRSIKYDPEMSYTKKAIKNIVLVNRKHKLSNKY